MEERIVISKEVADFLGVPAGRISGLIKRNLWRNDLRLHSFLSVRIEEGRVVVYTTYFNFFIHSKDGKLRSEIIKSRGYRPPRGSRKPSLENIEGDTGQWG